jgi:hypothetical protein
MLRDIGACSPMSPERGNGRTSLHDNGRRTIHPWLLQSIRTDIDKEFCGRWYRAERSVKLCLIGFIKLVSMLPLIVQRTLAG